MSARLYSAIEDLSLLADRQERIDYLISLAEEFQNADVPRTAETRVPGCESEVYISATPAGEGFKFNIAVDNPHGVSAKALAALLDQTFSGAPPRQVAELSE